jgi:integrase
MKGNIYCSQKCPVCGGKMEYDAKRSGCFCGRHPDIPASKGFRVRYPINGQYIQQRFTTVAEAEQFLNGLRFKEGNPNEILDPRDYQRDNPLGFENLVEKWLNIKVKQKIKKTTLANHRRNMDRAIAAWANRNIKAITDGEIEDFLYADHLSARTGEIISDKTRAEIRSTLHDFWSWVCRRERIGMPYIPHISYELGWREYISIQEQVVILDEVRRITRHNPRIWLGIHILSHNPIRPGELVRVTEGDVYLDQRVIMIRYPKGGNKGAWAWLWGEEIEVLQSLPTALPDVPLFRHVAKQSGIQAGMQFGPTQFNRWWKRACKTLGIEKNVGIYGGTKHTQVTGLKGKLSPEQIRRGGTEHATSRAFNRYLIANSDDHKKYQEAMRELREEVGKKVKVVDIKKAK